MNVLSRAKRLFRTERKRLRDSYSTRSYSQCGEDILVDYVFRLRGIEKPSYIDIGANHPFAINNTARFYERGCRGVNIDPNPASIQLFNEHRPKDINLNVGISDKAGESDFFVMEDDRLSTFSPNELNHLVSNGQTRAGVAKVKLMTLPDVIEKYCEGIFPDFMSLDVEGMELTILHSIDFEHRFPKVICVEIAEYSPVGAGKRRVELVEFLLSKDYYEYANTNLNSIMVQNQFWFSSNRADTHVSKGKIY